MTRTLLRAGALSCALLTTTALTLPAHAQTPRQYRNLDANGVDLTHGDFIMAFPEGSVGSGEAELALIRTSAGGMASQWDNYAFRLVRNSNSLTITISRPDRRSDTFTGSVLNPNFTPTTPNGSSLTRESGTGAYVYRTSDGTAVTFANPSYDAVPPDPYYCAPSSPQTGCAMLLETVASPDGNVAHLSFDTPANGDSPKLLSVSNSFGYAIVFSYSGYNRTSADFKRSGATVASVSYAYPSAGVGDETSLGLHAILYHPIRGHADPSRFDPACGMLSVKHGGNGV